MDKIYAIDGATMERSPSKMERQNVELNLDCTENIEEIASMVMNTLKHGNKEKTDGSKNIKNEKMERIIRKIKEKLVIEKLEDEIISKTPKPDQARMKKTLGEIELDSKLSIRVRLNLLVKYDHFFKKIC